jgi:hypothetical protein
VMRTGYSGRSGGVPSPRVQQRRSCCGSARRGAPAGLTSWFDPAESREKDSRVQPAPFEGAVC